MTIKIVHHGDWPGLAERAEDVDEDVWPEYNRHGDILNGHWPRLYTDFPEYQFLVYDDESDELLAEGHTVPFYWDGNPDHLSNGIDDAISDGMRSKDRGETPNTLCALAAEIPPAHQSKGLAPTVLKAMSDTARANGLEHFLAPVRPNFKERYPLTPIENYIRWTRDDGLPFDPWIRVHVRMGAKVHKALPRSLLITGTVAEWEEWTGMAFPETGSYVFPHGLAPLEVDVEADEATYWEPNLWIEHPL